MSKGRCRCTYGSAGRCHCQRKRSAWWPAAPGFVRLRGSLARSRRQSPTRRLAKPEAHRHCHRRRSSQSEATPAITGVVRDASSHMKSALVHPLRLNRRCRINAARTRDAYTDHVQQHVGAVVPDSPEWNHRQDGSFGLKRTGDGCQLSCRANIIGSDEKPSPTRSHKASIAAPCYILPNITVSVAHVHSIDTEIDATRAVQSNAGRMRIRVVHVLGQEVAVGEIPMSAFDMRVAFRIKMPLGDRRIEYVRDHFSIATVARRSRRARAPYRRPPSAKASRADGQARHGAVPPTPHRSEGPAADFSRSAVASPVPREAHVRPSPALAASTRRRILPCCRPVAKVHRLVFESVAPTSALPSDLPGIGKSNCALPAAHDLLCELSVAVVRLYQHRPKISACPTHRVFTETRTDGKSKAISRTSAAGRPAGHAHRPA